MAQEVVGVVAKAMEAVVEVDKILSMMLLRIHLYVIPLVWSEQPSRPALYLDHKINCHLFLNRQWAIGLQAPKLKFNWLNRVEPITQIQIRRAI